MIGKKTYVRNLSRFGNGMSMIVAIKSEILHQKRDRLEKKNHTTNLVPSFKIFVSINTILSTICKLTRVQINAILQKPTNFHAFIEYLRWNN